VFDDDSLIKKAAIRRTANAPADIGLGVLVAKTLKKTSIYRKAWAIACSISRVHSGKFVRAIAKNASASDSLQSSQKVSNVLSEPSILRAEATGL
jgi:hypothetical protein